MYVFMFCCLVLQICMEIRTKPDYSYKLIDVGQVLQYLFLQNGAKNATISKDCFKYQ